MISHRFWNSVGGKSFCQRVLSLKVWPGFFFLISICFLLAIVLLVWYFFPPQFSSQGFSFFFSLLKEIYTSMFGSDGESHIRRRRKSCVRVFSKRKAWMHLIPWLDAFWFFFTSLRCLRAYSVIARHCLPVAEWIFLTQFTLPLFALPWIKMCSQETRSNIDGMPDVPVWRG